MKEAKKELCRNERRKRELKSMYHFPIAGQDVTLEIPRTGKKRGRSL